MTLAGTLYEEDGSEVALLPGMVASIDVLSGKELYLTIFGNGARTKDKALRD